MAYTTIDDPSAYFQTAIWTGNGSSSHAITFDGNSDLQPDWTWIKSRSNATDHILTDIVRGVGVGIKSNTTAGNANDSNQLKSFNSNGFTLGSENDVNGSSRTYASWNWKAGTSVSGNTGGSGTAKSYSGSVNTDAGFSIISYTGNFTNGQTTPHHLGAVPKMIIVKNYANASESWNVYHESIGNTKYLVLNTDAAVGTAPRWNNTSPTSTVFTNGANGATNANNETIIAYCFAEKKGYSKISSYVGNGNADGTFVYTGFKPAFIFIRRTTPGTSWAIQDNKRLGYNVNESTLFPDTSGAEGGGKGLDILSNGFKMRSTSGANNSSGNTFIYYAVAENPFVTSTGVPATAR